MTFDEWARQAFFLGPTEQDSRELRYCKSAWEASKAEERERTERMLQERISNYSQTRVKQPEYSDLMDIQISECRSILEQIQARTEQIRKGE